MTKKDFEAMATAFGRVGRDILDAGDEDGFTVLNAAVVAFASEARRLNEAFDEVRFYSWVNDVARGDRDLDGNRVRFTLAGRA